METFSALLAICAGNSPVAGEFPAKASDANSPQRPVTRSFDVFFDLRLNIRLISDLRRHCAHCDVIVMFYQTLIYNIDKYLTSINSEAYTKNNPNTIWR